MFVVFVDVTMPFLPSLAVLAVAVFVAVFGNFVVPAAIVAIIYFNVINNLLFTP